MAGQRQVRGQQALASQTGRRQHRVGRRSGSSSAEPRAHGRGQDGEQAVVALAGQVAAVEAQPGRVEHGVVRRGDDAGHAPARAMCTGVHGKTDVEAFADVVLAVPAPVAGRAHELADRQVAVGEQRADRGGRCGDGPILRAARAAGLARSCAVWSRRDHRDALDCAPWAARARWPIRSSKPAGRCSPWLVGSTPAPPRYPRPNMVDPFSQKKPLDPLLAGGPIAIG